MGILFLNQGLAEEAIPWLEKASMLDPLDQEILQELNLARIKAGKKT